MRVDEAARCAVRVVGVGSSHGNDRAGWLVAERLTEEAGWDPSCTVDVTTVGDPLRLVALLEGCSRLIVVDACRSGRPAGMVVCATWGQVQRGLTGVSGGDAGPSSHGLGVAAALGLAEALGRVPDPDTVMLVGIEVGGDEQGSGFLPVSEPSAAVKDAVSAACRLVRKLIENAEEPGDHAVVGLPGNTTAVFPELF